MKALHLLLAMSMMFGNYPALAASGEPTAPPRANQARADDHQVHDPTITKIDSQIATLRSERARVKLTGPVVTTSVGGGVATVGVIVLAIGAVIDGEKFCVRGDSRSQKECEEEPGINAKGAIAGGAIVAAIGLGSFIGGLIWLNRRMDQRRAIDKQILELRQDKKSFLDMVDYGFDFRGDRRMLTTRFKF